MSFWKKMKQDTTAMFEKMKVKKIEETPEFKTAHEHYKELKKCSKEFLSQSVEFLELVSKMIPNFDEVCKNVKPAIDTIEDASASNFIKCLDEMDEKLSANSQDYTNRINEQIISPMKVICGQMKELGNTAKEHERMTLLLISNKEKLAKLEKKNKNHKEIEKYQQKVEDKTKTVADLESSFISTVTSQWNNRTVILQKPLSDLNSLLMEYCQMIQQASLPLQENIGQELMQKDYQVAPSTN